MSSATASEISGEKEELFVRFRQDKIDIDDLTKRVYKMDHPRHRFRAYAQLIIGVFLPLLFVGAGANDDT